MNNLQNNFLDADLQKFQNLMNDPYEIEQQYEIERQIERDRNARAQDPGQFSDLIKIKDNVDILGFLAQWLEESNTFTFGQTAWQTIAKQVLKSNYIENQLLGQDRSLDVEKFIIVCSPARYGLTLNNLIQRLRNLGLENCAVGLERRLLKHGITPVAAPVTARVDAFVTAAVSAPQEKQARAQDPGQFSDLIKIQNNVDILGFLAQWLGESNTLTFGQTAWQTIAKQVLKSDYAGSQFLKQDRSLDVEKFIIVCSPARYGLTLNNLIQQLRNLGFDYCADVLETKLRNHGITPVAAPVTAPVAAAREVKVLVQQEVKKAVTTPALELFNAPPKQMPIAPVAPPMQPVQQTTQLPKKNTLDIGYLGFEAHEKRVAEQFMIEQQIESARKARSPSPLADLIKDPEIRHHLYGMLCASDPVFHMEIWRRIAANALVHKKAQPFAVNQFKTPSDRLDLDPFIAWCDKNGITIADIKSAARNSMSGQTDKLDLLIQNNKMVSVTAPQEVRVPAQPEVKTVIRTFQPEPFNVPPKQKPIAPVAPPMQPVQQTTQLPKKNTLDIETYISTIGSTYFYNPIGYLGFEAHCLLEKLLSEESKKSGRQIWEAFLESRHEDLNDFKQNGQFLRRFFSGQNYFSRENRKDLSFARLFTYLSDTEGRATEVDAIKKSIKMQGIPENNMQGTPAKNRTNGFPLDPSDDGIFVSFGDRSQALLKIWEILNQPSRAEMPDKMGSKSMKIYETVAETFPWFSLKNVQQDYGNPELAPTKFLEYIWGDYARPTGRVGNLHITYTLDDLLEHFILEGKLPEVKEILKDLRDVLEKGNTKYDQKHLEKIIDTLNSKEFN